MRHVRMLGLGLAAAFIISAVAAGSALASETQFNLALFKECPLKNPLTQACSYGHTFAGEGGHYTTGPITVQISNSIVFQGGFFENPEGGQTFLLPANGQAVVPVAEPVPGDPLANVTPAEQKEFNWPPELQKKYENARINGLLGPGKVTEVIQSAGVPGLNLLSFILREGDAIIAPVKILGENAWLHKLGRNCEIGSTRDPIVQHLTTGTSTSPLTGESITGGVNGLEIEGGGELANLNDVHLVDNTFSVPAAEGCGGPLYEKYLDPVVNRAFGLPEPAGASVTELAGEFATTGVALLKEHGIK